MKLTDLLPNLHKDTGNPVFCKVLTSIEIDGSGIRLTGHTAELVGVLHCCQLVLSPGGIFTVRLFSTFKTVYSLCHPLFFI